jgi:hypothetical protein
MYATHLQLQNFSERWFNLAQHMISKKKKTSRSLEQNKRDITTCLRQQHALNIKLVFAVATVTGAHTFAARAR